MTCIFPVQFSMSNDGQQICMMYKLSFIDIDLVYIFLQKDVVIVDERTYPSSNLR